MNQLLNIKVINNTTIIIIFIFILKSLTVLYYSSRNITLGFPFDSFGFDPFHRFTDYLMIWEISKIENIYDLSSEIYKNLTPAPYGFLQFLLLKIVPFQKAGITKYLNFLILLIIFVYLNWKIYSENIIDKKHISNQLIIYITFITLNYPLFFLIDRGNLDIYAAIFLSILMLRNCNLGKNPDNLINALLLAIIISLKPSFGLFGIVLILFFSIKNIIPAIILILLSYSFPILIYDASYTYLIESIFSAKKQLGAPTVFCHNFACGTRSIGINTNKYFSLIYSIALLPYFIYWTIKINKIEKGNTKLFLYTFIAIIATLALNDPSPDYRLIFLIPIFMLFSGHININIFKKNEVLLLITFFSLIFSFTNIYIKNLDFNYYTTLRVIGIMGLFHIIMVAHTRWEKNRSN